MLTDDEGDEEAGANGRKRAKKDYQGVKTPKMVMDDMGLGTKKRKLGAADFSGSGNDGSTSSGAF